MYLLTYVINELIDSIIAFELYVSCNRLYYHLVEDATKFDFLNTTMASVPTLPQNATRGSTPTPYFIYCVTEKQTMSGLSL
jgi:hypothetical protein